MELDFIDNCWKFQNYYLFWEYIWGRVSNEKEWWNIEDISRKEIW